MKWILLTVCVVIIVGSFVILFFGYKLTWPGILAWVLATLTLGFIGMINPKPHIDYKHAKKFLKNLPEYKKDPEKKNNTDLFLEWIKPDSLSNRITDAFRGIWAFTFGCAILSIWVYAILLVVLKK